MCVWSVTNWSSGWFFFQNKDLANDYQSWQQNMVLKIFTCSIDSEKIVLAKCHDYIKCQFFYGAEKFIGPVHLLLK